MRFLLRPISMDDMLNKYAPIVHLEDGGITENRATCGNWECYQESVAQLEDEGWVCFSCLDVEECVWKCEECGRLVAGGRIVVAGEPDIPLCFPCSCEQPKWLPDSGGVM